MDLTFSFIKIVRIKIVFGYQVRACVPVAQKVKLLTVSVRSKVRVYSQGAKQGAWAAHTQKT